MLAATRVRQQSIKRTVAFQWQQRYREQAQAASAAGDTAEAARLNEQAENWQKAQVALNMVASGLIAPTESVAGIAAAAVAPGLSYQIGQYFKAKGKEDSPEHILMHALLGGSGAAAGDNNALLAALSAGGAEALAPVLSSYLYNTTDPSQLSPEQKETIASLTGLMGNVVGSISGKGSDIIASGQSAQTAVDNNRQLHPKEVRYLSDPERIERFRRYMLIEEGLQLSTEEAQKLLDRNMASAMDAQWTQVNGKTDRAAREFITLEVVDSKLNGENVYYFDTFGIPHLFFTVTAQEYADPRINLKALFSEAKTFFGGVDPAIQRYLSNNDHLQQYVSGTDAFGRPKLTEQYWQQYYQGEVAGSAYASEHAPNLIETLFELPAFAIKSVVSDEIGLYDSPQMSEYYESLLRLQGRPYELGFLNANDRSTQAQLMWQAFAFAQVLNAGTEAIGTVAKTVSGRLGLSAVKGGAEIGSKLEYFLGRATGSKHNIDRSKEMLRRLENVGLPDTAATRQYLSQHLSETYANPASVLRTQENGRIVRESLLMGPNGVVKMETIWDGNRLITGTVYPEAGRFIHGTR